MIIVQDFILLLLLFITVMVVCDRDLLNNIIYMGVFSFFMALMFALLNAPDVGLTEASVGSGLSTLLLVLAARPFDQKALPIYNMTALFLASCGAAIICFVASRLPDFGSATLVGNAELIPAYVQASGEHMGNINMVTAVLANFRAYDTLGETLVVFTAAIAVLLILADDNDS